MKTRCLATLLFLLAGSLSSLRGQQLLSGVTELRFQAATSTATGPRSVTFQNVRARSSSTTLDDYLEIDYKADLATLQMRPSAVRVFKGVGIYNIEEKLFMKDVPATFIWKTPSGTSVTSNGSGLTNVSCDGSKPIVLSNLSAGMGLTMFFLNLTGPFSFALTGPGEAKPASFPQVQNVGGLVSYKVPILKTGTHNLWVVPGNSGSTISFSYYVGNENAGTAAIISSGQSFSGSFNSNIRSYVKRRVFLRTGQRLTANFSNSYGNPDCRIIRQDGVNAGGLGNVENGSSTGVTADTEGYYYVVLIQPERNVLGSQSAAATITVTIQ